MAEYVKKQSRNYSFIPIALQIEKKKKFRTLKPNALFISYFFPSV